MCGHIHSFFFIIAVVGASMTSGCSEYVDRREGVSPIAGDATRRNVALHAADPFSLPSRSVNIILGTERLVEAVDRNKQAPVPAQPPRAVQSTRQ